MSANAEAWVQNRGTFPGNPAQRSVVAFASRGESGARLALALGLLAMTPEAACSAADAKFGFRFLDAAR